jgi:multicomponent Na+:H+ antiporter subunit D
VVYATGTRDLKRLGGLGRQMPVTSATSMVASMSIAGIPPFNGFWSKLIIILACVQAGYYCAAVWAVVVSLITLASFLKVQRYAFFEAAKAAIGQVAREPLYMALAMVLLAVSCVATSLLVVTGFETPVLIGPAVEALLGGRFVL